MGNLHKSITGLSMSSISYSLSRSLSSRPSSFHQDMETHSFRVPGLPKFTTRAAEKRDADIKSSQYVLANQTGVEPLHTAWYINERGDKIWLKFDTSIPCTKFATTETRFYKPKLHKMCADPYENKKVFHNELIKQLMYR